MFKYQLWGTDIESDVSVDVTDSSFKRKLIELKVMIDRTYCLCTKFVISNGKVRAYPDASAFDDYQAFFIKRGEQVPSCYQDDLYSKTYDPQPIYNSQPMNYTGRKIGG